MSLTLSVVVLTAAVGAVEHWRARNSLPGSQGAASGSRLLGSGIPRPVSSNPHLGSFVCAV